ncbi:MAG: hypothetical protein QM204_01150 [Bacillota bacterium]|jgi:hypothetical protein|nr:hypothetical protein [Bacillota bacterium]NLL26314.1 hypothetical protein [Erysipelotrichia bacterium]
MKKKLILTFLIVFIISYIALTQMNLIKISPESNPYLYQLENAWQFKTVASTIIAFFLTWCFNSAKITITKITVVFFIAFIISYLIMSHNMYERRVYEKTILEWLIKQITGNFKLKAAISAAAATITCFITYLFSKKNK